MTERWTRLVPYRVEYLCPECGEPMRTSRELRLQQQFMRCINGHVETSTQTYPYVTHREEPVVP